MIWYVALGGGVGSVLRFLLGRLIQDRAGGVFPWGTLLVNIAGSFLLGFLMEYALATPVISRETRAMLTTGFCGGFTTFSTFSYETMTLMRDGDYRGAGLYIGLSLVLSVAAMFGGLILARELLALRRAL